LNQLADPYVTFKLSKVSLNAYSSSTLESVQLYNLVDFVLHRFELFTHSLTRSLSLNQMLALFCLAVRQWYIWPTTTAVVFSQICFESYVASARKVHVCGGRVTGRIRKMAIAADGGTLTMKILEATDI
jgi:hypothetical protein